MDKHIIIQMQDLTLKQDIVVWEDRETGRYYNSWSDVSYTTVEEAMMKHNKVRATA